MIASQRKAHKYTWLVLAIFLPTVLFFAVKDITFTKHSRKMEEEALIVRISDKQVEIKLNTPFPNPSAVVYSLDSAGKKEALLGQLQGTGMYTFRSTTAIEGVLIWDEIKGVELHKMAR